MSVTIEIPTDLQPFVDAALATGRFTNEQELVTEILRISIPALKGLDRVRNDAQISLNQFERGEVRDADFEGVRQQLTDEFDGSRDSD